MKFAIVVITYNRLKSVKRLVDSLQKAWYDGDSVDLIVSIDKSKSDEVERWAETVTWTYGKYMPVKHDKNLGLRAHVLECGNRVNDYDAIAVFEDDVTVSPNFYRFAKQCVEKYQDDERVAGISLYAFPHAGLSVHPFTPLYSGYDVFFMNIAQSWGQVWMKRQWNEFYEWYMSNPSEFEYKPGLGNLHLWPKTSWLKYHIKYCIEKNKYFVYPYQSLSTNNNEAGSHARSGKYSSTLCQANLQTLPIKGYRLPSVDECEVKYDFYYEAKYLAHYMNLTEDELCVDFYGLKTNDDNRRYWLTCKPLPYKIIKSYDLAYKPYENNIIMDREGDFLFLYDTSENATPPPVDKYYYYQYLYRDGLQKAFSIMGHFMPLKLMLSSYVKRRCKMFF